MFRAFAQLRHRRHRHSYQHLLANAAHFVGVSQGISNSLTATIGVPRKSITTIYNPVVTPHLHVKMAERPDHPWFLDGSTPVILAAGRLTAQKDYPTLIKAFARLNAQRPSRLIILGEGRMRKALERLVKGLDLTDHVSLPGWVENPFAFMSRASLFVLSSRFEGLPGVLVQALACGCPCVSTNCPAGPAEILQDGKFGPLVPVGDEKALADAMYGTLAQPPERHMLQQRAGYFSLERAVTAYEKLILGFA
jgi:glycosyltransferase involved in cell wall biosynthesis